MMQKHYQQRGNVFYLHRPKDFVVLLCNVNALIGRYLWEIPVVSEGQNG